MMGSMSSGSWSRMSMVEDLICKYLTEPLIRPIAWCLPVRSGRVKIPRVGKFSFEHSILAELSVALSILGDFWHSLECSWGLNHEPLHGLVLLNGDLVPLFDIITFKTQWICRCAVSGWHKRRQDRGGPAWSSSYCTIPLASRGHLQLAACRRPLSQRLFNVPDDAPILVIVSKNQSVC